MDVTPNNSLLETSNGECGEGQEVLPLEQGDSEPQKIPEGLASQDLPAEEKVATGDQFPPNYRLNLNSGSMIYFGNSPAEAAEYPHWHPMKTLAVGLSDNATRFKDRRYLTFECKKTNGARLTNALGAFVESFGGTSDPSRDLDDQAVLIDHWFSIAKQWQPEAPENDAMRCLLMSEQAVLAFCRLDEAMTVFNVYLLGSLIRLDIRVEYLDEGGQLPIRIGSISLHLDPEMGTVHLGLSPAHIGILSRDDSGELINTLFEIYFELKCENFTLGPFMHINM